MKVKILAFGIAKEIVGGSHTSLEIVDLSTVNDLQKTLRENFPKLQELTSFRIAVNSHFASSDERIHETDEIVIIPPVSGG